jgi:hypothetical protein
METAAAQAPQSGSVAEATGMLMSTMGYLAGVDFPELSDAEMAEALRVLERADAVEAVVRGKLVKVFDLSGGPSADAHQSAGAWLKWETGITDAQARAHKSWVGKLDEHPPIIGAMLTGRHMSASVAARCCGWTKRLPQEFRAKADAILAAAFQAGAGEFELARIAAELIAQLAPPDEDDGKFADRSLHLEDTLDGAGILRGEMTPEATAALHAVLDVLSRKCGKEDKRTEAERMHDALEEAMNRLLGAHDLLPKKGGAPVTALVHISLADLRRLDQDSEMESAWAGRIAQEWTGHRAANAVIGGDGGAWISGPAAAGIACDAALFPVVTGHPDLEHLRALVDVCVAFWHAEHAGTGTGTGTEGPVADRAANARLMEDLIRKILGKSADLLSGEPGLASMLRRGLAGPGLGGPSLPLDVGDTDSIPWHIRKAVDIRDPHCAWPGGCDRTALECEPHHIIHRCDHGRTCIANLMNLCHYHHHIAIHRDGWTLTLHPDGTSQATSPDGTRTLHSHERPPPKPPPRPG